MTESLRAGDFRICPSCGSRNKAAYNFCVRCNASLDAAATRAGAGVSTRPPNSRVKRFLLAAGVVAAIAVGLMVHAVSRATRDVQAITEDVRADSPRTVDAPAPPLGVTGWSPGANVPVAPEASSGPAHTATQTWSGDSFPVARPNPYDVPGDPNASMVGIAPRAPRVRAAMKRQRVFTDNDLLATRGGAWSTPALAPASPHP